MDIWTSLVLLITSIIVIYLVINFVIFKKFTKLSIYREKIINVLLLLGFIAFFLIIISYLQLWVFVFLFLNSLDTINALVLATTGIVLIFRTSITTNFAQGMMATFGAFMTSRVVTYLTSNIQFFKNNPELTLVTGIVAGVIVAFLLGIIIDVFIIRKAKRVTPIGKQMITMGLILVISGVMPLIFGIIPSTIPKFSNEIIPFDFLGTIITIPKHTVIGTYITITVLVILFTALKFSKWGLGVRATASNEIVAGMMGVNTRLITALSWAVAGGLGALAATIIAPTQGTLSVALMIPFQVNGFLASILGGFSSFGGPIIGAILIPSFTTSFSYHSSEWVNVIVYIVILLLVLIKPNGLFGKRVAKKV